MQSITYSFNHMFNYFYFDYLLNCKSSMIAVTIREELTHHDHFTNPDGISRLRNRYFARARRAAVS